jgi:broad specificity phosphatase PhoE
MLEGSSVAASVQAPRRPQSDSRGTACQVWDYIATLGAIVKHTWPKKIWIVRHGESAGNVARDAADRAGFTRIDIAARDVDVPLSSLGHEQSQALGEWFAQLPPDVRPNVIVSSPYRRSVQTAEIVGGYISQDLPAAPVIFDERLREKEFGILDRLTHKGIEELHPDQADFRRLLGKFYHRPPAGESWCDVILRLRSALDTISLHHADERVLIVGHQVVVLCMRYIIENLSEADILGIDAEGDVANCGLTEYEFDPSVGTAGEMVLRRYNFVAPLQAAGAEVTAEKDANVAAR